MDVVRVFDDRQTGHTSDGLMVACVSNADAVGVLVHGIGASATVRCGACEHVLWDCEDAEEYRTFSALSIGVLIEQRTNNHAFRRVSK